MIQRKTFKKKVLSSVIAACAFSVATTSYAQETDNVEEIVVTGVRAAQERAIDIKRNSAEVVDSISAEDIGKLPDATIADSLQRVTGVQIQRSGGQGGIVSIRGSREVLTTLNGELFLTAENILNNQANYQDVPASLIAGSNVYKSMSAKNLEGGIGGAVDLLTRRSLKLDDGFSAAVRGQVSSGTITDSENPELNGLFGYKNDNWGTSLGFSIADQTVSDNSMNTQAGARPFVAESNEFANGSWIVAGKDLNGDGDQNDQFINMWEWNGPEVRQNNTERERLGLSYNFNSSIGDALELNVDMFYNNMSEDASGNSMQLGEGNDWNWGNYTKMLGIHSTDGVGEAVGKSLNAKYFATGWESLMNGNLRTGIYSDIRDTSAFNNSIDLKYDNGDAFTGTARFVSSKAYRTGTGLRLAQKASSPGGAGGQTYNADGAKDVINPGYISSFFPTRFETNDGKAQITFDPAFVSAMKDPNAWYVHSSWLEGENHEVNLEVLRGDGNYKIADTGITSVDFGFRRSERSAERETFHYFMPLGVQAYDASGKAHDMMVKFHEAGYVYHAVKGGTIDAYQMKDSNGVMQPITFDPFIPKAVELSDPHVAKYVTNVSNLGAAASSFNAVIPMLDAKKAGNHLAFMNDLYQTEHVKRERPDQSYLITEAKDTMYFNFNFDTPINDTVSVSGTAGVRHIKESLAVTKNITDGRILADDIFAGTDPNHTHYMDLGDETTYVDRSRFLPSVNASVLFDEEFKLRLSYDERTSLQSLNNLGEGSRTGWSSNNTDPVTGNVFQRHGGITMGGNPNLKPWEASVYNLAGEWYPTESALLSLTAFYMDIGGFTDSVSVFDPTLADSDGVVRSGASINSLENGKNATVKGLEFAYQQSFDFLPGILSNTGITFNYTYSPSTRENEKFATTGDEVPFNNTARDQSNLVLWYNDDKFESRVAFNYLSKRYNGNFNNSDSLAGLSRDMPEGYIGGLPTWAKETLFIDFNSTYHITDNLEVSLNANNITEEGDLQYYHWEELVSQSYIFERRISLGVNAKF